MSWVIPASATEVFRNERRERFVRVKADGHFIFSIIEMIISPKQRHIKKKKNDFLKPHFLSTD